MLATAISQYRRRQRLAASAVSLARGAWRLLDRHALDATAGRFLGRLAPALTEVQLASARSAGAYVPRALAELGLNLDPLGELMPGSLAGIASDGRPLASLLTVPVRTVKVLSAGGVPVDRAMATGRRQLERIAATQVADAGRVAEGVMVAATPGAGYTRMLNPPSCSRCAILAGRFYSYSAGFLRHPLCDCLHIPSNEDAASDLRTDPRGYFDSLTEVEQDRIFTQAGAEAIRLGADPAQVVNARRGMSTTVTRSGRRRQATVPVFGQQNVITLEGTTRRGVAGRHLIAEGQRLSRSPGDRVQIPRLMPEEIFRLATSRDDSIRLLRRFRYIT